MSGLEDIEPSSGAKTDQPMSSDSNQTVNAFELHEFPSNPSAVAVRAELKTVVSSAAFRDQDRPRRLLTYLVEESLAGRANGLKAYAIAMDVFGRGPNFDQSTDAVVRVHASRLRAVLAEYYAGDGRLNPVRIGLPKGTYVPTFSLSASEISEQPGRGSEAQGTDSNVVDNGSPPVSASLGRWWQQRSIQLVVLSVLLALFGAGISVLAPREAQLELPAINSIGLVPIWTSSNEPDLKGYAAQLGKELLRTISTSHYITLKRVDRLDSPAPSSLKLLVMARSLDVRWLLLGTVSPQHPGSRRVVMSIVDGLTGRYVWSSAYEEAVPAQSVGERAEAIIADIRPEFLAISKRALEQAGPTHYSPLEHFLLSTWTSGTGSNRLDWEQERVGIARAATMDDPRFGPAHAVLADKLAYLANVDPPSDTESNRREARMHAQAAMEASPDMAEAVFNVSAHYWHSGQLQEAIHHSERTLDLSPQHVLGRLHVIAVPYTCLQAPPDAIRQLEALDQSVSSTNPIRWVIHSWIARLHLNNGDFEQALRFAKSGDRIFRTPDTLIQMAALLVRTGQPTEARDLLQSQKANWPNLDVRHYFKTTMARRCHEQGMSKHVQETYEFLLQALH